MVNPKLGFPLCFPEACFDRGTWQFFGVKLFLNDGATLLIQIVGICPICFLTILFFVRIPSFYVPTTSIVTRGHSNQNPRWWTQNQGFPCVSPRHVSIWVHRNFLGKIVSEWWSYLIIPKPSEYALFVFWQHHYLCVYHPSMYRLRVLLRGGIVVSTQCGEPKTRFSPVLPRGVFR